VMTIANSDNGRGTSTGVAMVVFQSGRGRGSGSDEGQTSVTIKTRLDYLLGYDYSLTATCDGSPQAP
jgi:hypothetical protein